MKTIGILGGMSWVSSAEYYRLINQEVSKRLGGLHSANIVMYSVDFAPIEEAVQKNRWDLVSQLVADGARHVEAGGADFLVLAVNTVHSCADSIQASVSIPLLHIVDPAAEAVRSDGLKTVGLLGTRFTMEHGFFRKRLESKFGLIAHHRNKGTSAKRENNA